MNKIDSISVLLEAMNPDVISVVEHWCSDESLSVVVLPGYDRAASFCRSKREHGGSAIFTRIGLVPRDLQVTKMSEEMECESCAVKINIGQNHFTIISVYRPPSGNLEIFLEKLSSILQHCERKNDIVFLCGDLNINYLIDSSRSKQLLDDLLKCFNLKITSLCPTRIITDLSNRSTSTKVDYIVSNCDLNCCKTNVFPPHFGDHLAIVLDYYFDHSDIVPEQSKKKYYVEICPIST